MQNVIRYTQLELQPLEWVTRQSPNGKQHSYLTVTQQPEITNNYERIAAFNQRPKHTPPEGLFLQFGQLQPTHDAILEFAQRHGYLGVLDTLEWDDSKRIPLRQGEHLERWQREIHVMKYAVELWRNALHGEAADPDVFERYIVWEPYPDARDKAGRKLEGREWVVFASHPIDEFKVDYPPPTHYMAAIATENDAGMFVALESNNAQFERRDYLRAVSLFLQQEVNKRLTMDLETSRSAEQFAPKIHVEVAWDEETNRQTGVLVASNLLTFMWLQLHEAITGRTVFQQCQLCGTWFRPKKARGQPRKWCSNSCRVQNSYRLNGRS